MKKDAKTTTDTPVEEFDVTVARNSREFKRETSFPSSQSVASVAEDTNVIVYCLVFCAR